MNGDIPMFIKNDNEPDICVRVGDGVINMRVGAIIIKNNHVLMVKNARDDYYYSVGGRIQFGETAGQAVIREVYEETGINLEIDRLGFVSENYFYGTIGDETMRLIYEPGFYFYMKVPEYFEPHCESRTADGLEERLEWVPFDTDKTVYPTFFKTELANPVNEMRFIVMDERD